ncbi:MAG: MFS transporter, partial [Candidatus Omnitrophica bacterium]|nr:MFS transporter [Candidatus Omnitrophota bacterium]
MTKFREVFKNRNFISLWLGQIISQFGDRLNHMALIALLYARAPGSALQLAKVFSCTIIPVFLVGPIACSCVDRWDHRRTMVIGDLLRAALIALIAIFFVHGATLVPIYIIIFLVFSVSRFFVPAKMSIIPELVSKDKLLLANSLSSTTGMIAAVVGFGLGGLIVERVGSQGGFFLDSLTYVISASFIFSIATRRVFRLEGTKNESKSEDTPKPIIKTSILSDIKDGWLYVVRNKSASFVGRTFFLVWSAVGAVYVVTIVFVQKTLGSVTRDLGVLAMCLGAGLLCGALTYGRLGEKLSKIRMIFLALAVSGAVLSIWTVFLQLFASILFTAGLSFILGLTLSPIMISSHTLIHQFTDEKMRGRVFGTLEIIAHLGFLIFMFISSFLAERIG